MNPRYLGVPTRPLKREHVADHHQDMMVAAQPALLVVQHVQERHHALVGV